MPFIFEAVNCNKSKKAGARIHDGQLCRGRSQGGGASPAQRSAGAANAAHDPEGHRADAGHRAHDAHAGTGALRGAQGRR